MASNARLFAFLGLGVAVLGAAVALVVGRVERNGAGSCAAAAVTARLKPLAVGEIAAFHVAETPRPLPEMRFRKPDGAERRLVEPSGKLTLFNLWATWCAPCRKEMPALDALQAELGSERFEVVAVNIDTRNLERPRAWLAENNISRLAYYSDPEAHTFQALRAAGKAVGMPTTLLVDGKGCELGVMHGAADWASAEAKALIRAALAP
jgi:thiol-disulfide isomerase/thioredoxin